MKLLLPLLTMLHLPIQAINAQDTGCTDYKTHQIKKVTLPNNVVAWIHGKELGSLVTINGSPAPAGIYDSKNHKITFVTDEDGKLISPIKEK